MTPKAFDEGMAILAATFPSFGIVGASLAVWHRLLDDLEDDIFLAAVIRLCGEEKQLYPGTNVVALIRERAMSKSTGVLALARVEDAMQRVGAYRSIVFDDLVIHLVVSRMGGWPKLCQVNHEEWKFLRRDFERLYDAVCRESIPEDQVPRRLAGLHEIGNSAAGCHDTPVQLQVYGDKAKALAWTGKRKDLPGPGIELGKAKILQPE